MMAAITLLTNHWSKDTSKDQLSSHWQLIVFKGWGGTCEYIKGKSCTSQPGCISKIYDILTKTFYSPPLLKGVQQERTQCNRNCLKHFYLSLKVNTESSLLEIVKLCWGNQHSADALSILFDLFMDLQTHKATTPKTKMKTHVTTCYDILGPC